MTKNHKTTKNKKTKERKTHDKNSIPLNKHTYTRIQGQTHI